MKNKIYSIIFLSISVLTLFFSNCSQQGAIELKQVSGDLASPLATPPIVDEILMNCARAQQNGQLRVSNQTVLFDDSRIESNNAAQICEFPETGQSANGNLPINDSHMQSRYEQTRVLNLPAGAVICDIKMTNNLQSFRYDDVFFFNFNGYLLATNNKTAVNSQLSPVNSLALGSGSMTDVYRYDWLKLRTARFENVADDYCMGSAAGLSSCTWPVSEQPGRIQFNFDQSLLIALSAGVPSQQQRFSFVITGDNDRSLDCYHEKLEFNMSVNYYVP